MAAIERGTRDLSLLELASVLGALELDLAALRGGGRIAIGDAISVEVDQLLDTLAGEATTWTVFGRDGDSAMLYLRTGTMGSYGEALKRILGTYPDADRKAALRLGVAPEDVSRAAESLWGRTLTEERDERVAALAPEDATPRSMQALRGHITRTLLREIGPLVKTTQDREGAAE